MSNQEAPFSFTTKIGNDLFTVRGGSYEEFLANLVSGGNVPALQRLASILDGQANADDPVQMLQEAFGAEVIEQVQTFAPVAPSVPTQTPALGGNDRSCAHGVMVKRTGSSAKGEWRAFFCPTPKGTDGQCSPVFAKRGTPEWNSF